MVIPDFAFFPIRLRPEMGRQSLYMNAPFPTPLEDGLLIEKDEALTVDGVMTALYDRELLPFVGGKRLALRVKVQGACRVALIHRTSGGSETEYGSVVSSKAIRSRKYEKTNAELQTFDLDFRLMTSEQSFGRWFFRIEPFRFDVKLISATWLVREAEVAPIIPAFVICTFKRERQVAANVRLLSNLLDSAMHPVREKPPTLLQRLGLAQEHGPEPTAEAFAQAGIDDYGILLVDNAATLSPSVFPSSHIRLITQRNVGGAGGFGRGIYEAIEAGTYTHIILLDDDADIDDVSIVRMINLLRLTNDPSLFVGGLQFDTYSPCRLADAGAYWTPERFERPIARLAPCDMGSLDGKDGLARSHNSNFNGWWLFGGRVEGFKTYGMPLPCFVHLDDVEFGVRVQLNGGRTVTVPGIAVWHEPYYAKVEGWFAYYNIRNELIRLSAQTPIALSQITDRSPAVVAKRSKERLASASKQLRTRFRDFVNTYQYGSAILLAKAIDDFASGPAILLDQDAEALHMEVMATYKDANVNYRASTTLPPGFVAQPPTQGRKLYRIAQIYSRNGNRLPITGPTEANRMTIFRNRGEINWKWLRARQAWGYPDPGSSTYHTYKFDRDVYTKVDAYFTRAIRSFETNAREAQANWSDAYPELTSHNFWSRLVKTF